jgi:hypothetical protein
VPDRGPGALLLEEGRVGATSDLGVRLAAGALGNRAHPRASLAEERYPASRNRARTALR